MNWEAIGAIGEVLGALSVLVTLFYLAQQIRQSNKIAKASSEVSIRNSFSAINTLLGENRELVEIAVKMEDTDCHLSKVEYLRIRSLLLQLTNVWISVEAAYENGMASKNSFEHIFDDITQLTTNWPATKPILLNIIAAYPSQGKSEIYKAIRKASMPGG